MTAQGDAGSPAAAPAAGPAATAGSSTPAATAGSSTPAAAPAHTAPPPRALPGGGQTRLHRLVAIVVDRPGVLNRVASLFRRRNFNVDAYLRALRTDYFPQQRQILLIDACQTFAAQWRGTRTLPDDLPPSGRQQIGRDGCWNLRNRDNRLARRRRVRHQHESE